MKVTGSAWNGIRAQIIGLSTQLRKYGLYLKDQRNKTKCTTGKLSFVQMERKIWHTYEGKKSFSDSEKARYGLLNQQAADFVFVPICLKHNLVLIDISIWKHMKTLFNLKTILLATLILI